jgi:hypothetical protein
MIITKFRWFWAWQDEDEEQWLNTMSESGFHLSSISLGLYSFTVGQPQHFVYRLDYQWFHNQDKQEYMQLFRDAGWEHVEKILAWQYFRKLVKPGENDNIYTDVSSKIACFQPLETIMTVWFFVELTYFLVNLLFARPYPWWFAIQAVYLLLMTFQAYAIIKLHNRVKQMKQFKSLVV